MTNFAVYFQRKNSKIDAMSSKLHNILIVLGVFLGFIFVSGAFFYFRYIYPSQTYEIVLTEDGFEPTSITIKKFDSVKFSMMAGKRFWPASNLHPLHDIYSAFDPKMPIEPDATWSFRFTKTGVWNFHDHLFPTYRGTITVLPATLKSDFSLEDITGLKFDIKNVIASKGASAAYQKLKGDFADNLFTERHVAAHLFGEILYEELGTKGMEVCDETFGFGCYHGLFVRAVANEGLGVAKELDQICVEKFGYMGLGCPHGIGHGLGEYMGPERLLEQLQICSELTWQGDVFGCSGGVFMEHNSSVEVEGTNITLTVRALEGENYYAPCDLVPSRFKKSCIYEQASWWIEILDGDYEKIAQLCVMSDSSEVEHCFLGLGNNFTERAAYNIDIIKSLCGRMPDDTSQALCRAGAYWAFFANPEKTDQAQVLCEDLGSLRGFCLSKGNLLTSNTNERTI